MPMVDYLCAVCGYRFEEWHPGSDIPGSRKCPRLVDGTLCDGEGARYLSLPGEWRPVNARRFDPIVIHQAVDDADQFSFPGHSGDPTPAGYRRIEIDSVQAADYWTSRIDRLERAKAAETAVMNQAYFDEKTQARRERVDGEMRRTGLDGSGRARWLRDKAREFVDRRTVEKRQTQTGRGGFHIQVMAYDSSNRQPYADVRTGWKESKA